MIIQDWIIRNLQDHGNSVLPNDLIRKNGEKAVVEAIQEKMGCLIEIRKVESTLPTAPLNNHSHRKLEIVYIAEKVEKDRITLKEACETPIWQTILMGEPNRKISVDMTYVDLYIITNMIKEKKGNAKH